MASFASSATTCGARKHAWTKIILLDADDMKNHLHNKHRQMTHHEYNKAYMVYYRKRKMDELDKELTIDYKTIEDLIANSEMGKLKLPKYGSGINLGDKSTKSTESLDRESEFRDQVFSIAYDEIFAVK